VTAAVFGLKTFFSAFFGLTVPPLSFTVGFQVSASPAFIAAISLTSPAASADAKALAAPPAKYRYQYRRYRHPQSGLENCRKIG
jgi:hypothetical protein